jgi:hypothetical protein
VSPCLSYILSYFNLFHSLSPDLNARLQNLGSRIRRSEPVILHALKRVSLHSFLIPGVSEGYATHKFSPASVQTASPTSINDLPAPIFRSSNDTLRAVYSQLPYSTLAPSDRKRARTDSSIDEREEYPDGGGSMGQDNSESGTVMQSTPLIATDDLALSRPMKPLRRTPRTFGMTQSLPPAIFRSSIGEQDQTTPSASLQEEEEDWSTTAFSGDPLKIQSLG